MALDKNDIANQPNHLKGILYYIFLQERYAFQAHNLKILQHLGKNTDYEKTWLNCDEDSLTYLTQVLHLDHDFKKETTIRLEKYSNTEIYTWNLNDIITDNGIFKNLSASPVLNMFGAQVLFDISRLTFLSEILTIITGNFISSDDGLNYINQENSPIYFKSLTNSIIHYSKNAPSTTKNINLLTSLINICKNIKEIKIEYLEELRNQISISLQELIPILYEYDDEISYYHKFKSQLQKIIPGQKDWIKYENCLNEILLFSLLPQFSNIYVQVRTEDNHERRDFILSNTIYKGIWNSIFHQYNSNNIVFEAKNKKTGNKQDVNQLRIYLSKPTIGKFGILTLRNKTTKSLEIAIRQAYEQQRILILVFLDKDLLNLILNKIIFRSVDSFFELKKMHFEVNY